MRKLIVVAVLVAALAVPAVGLTQDAQGCNPQGNNNGQGPCPTPTFPPPPSATCVPGLPCPSPIPPGTPLPKPGSP